MSPRLPTAIVSAADHDTWAAAMQRAGARDVYYLPEYHQAYSFMGGRCLAYVADIGEETLFYPFILRPINQIGSAAVHPSANDIETIYGYTGPIATSTSPDFLVEAWRGFDVWCSEHNVISEFIRFNPVLRTERFAAAQVDVHLDRETVEIRLDLDEDQLWSSYRPAKRNKIRKAIKRGLACEKTDLDEGLAVFRHLYEETMRRARARDLYFFSQSYYDAIERTLAPYTNLFIARYENTPVAAALFLAYGENVHYHLSGTAVAAQCFAPNDLLLHEAALWSQRRGFKRLHLGGGRSGSPEDTLFEFKRQFSPHTLPFYLGRRIHDLERYDMLCNLWREQTDCRGTDSYFPIYRFEARRVSGS